mmetsp:Transcript_25213/g.34684  ORF Transcript_25213/g.34684 Transcript_25213/m.34684 type:complete len:397 (-) Transcript_25213:2274-3464(-)
MDRSGQADTVPSTQRSCRRGTCLQRWAARWASSGDRCQQRARRWVGSRGLGRSARVRRRSVPERAGPTGTGREPSQGAWKAARKASCSPGTRKEARKAVGVSLPSTCPSHSPSLRTIRSHCHRIPEDRRFVGRPCSRSRGGSAAGSPCGGGRVPRWSSAPGTRTGARGSRGGRTTRGRRRAGPTDYCCVVRERGWRWPGGSSVPGDRARSSCCCPVPNESRTVPLDRPAGWRTPTPADNNGLEHRIPNKHCPATREPSRRCQRDTGSAVVHRDNSVPKSIIRDEPIPRDSSVPRGTVHCMRAIPVHFCPHRRPPHRPSAHPPHKSGRDRTPPSRPDPSHPDPPPSSSLPVLLSVMHYLPDNTRHSPHTAARIRIRSQVDNNSPGHTSLSTPGPPAP